MKHSPILTPQTFRPAFTFTNSPGAIARFPDPFPDDTYRYTINLEPHRRGEPGSVFEHPFDLDEHYLSEVEERRWVLAEDPGRSATLPHMETAEWDALELILVSLARDYPAHFTLRRRNDGDWAWENHRLGVRDRFRFGDRQSLPGGPLEYVARQTQGDFVLLDQREGTLFLDGAVLTSQADWSLAFDLGMHFLEWHRPVPVPPESRLFERALRYLMGIQVGEPVRRLNWSLTANPRLDTSTEKSDEWAKERTLIEPENIGERLYLRVELQTLFRLPLSHALLFGIRTYLIRLQDFCSRPGRGRRTYRVMSSLPEEVVDYKGMRGFYPQLLAYLSPFESRG